ncbi:hypothetical protein RKD20_000111 [Streptomyces sp. SLBN-8D4]|jgi:hypothetical protein
MDSRSVKADATVSFASRGYDAGGPPGRAPGGTYGTTWAMPRRSASTSTATVCVPPRHHRTNRSARSRSRLRYRPGRQGPRECGGWKVVLADAIEPLGQPLAVSLGEDLSERTDVSGFQFGAVGQDGLHPGLFALGEGLGCRRIQPATVRGEGGGAVTGSAERRLVRTGVPGTRTSVGVSRAAHSRRLPSRANRPCRRSSASRSSCPTAIFPTAEGDTSLAPDRHGALQPSRQSPCFDLKPLASHSWCRVSRLSSAWGQDPSTGTCENERRRESSRAVCGPGIG